MERPCEETNLTYFARLPDEVEDEARNTVGGAFSNFLGRLFKSTKPNISTNDVGESTNEPCCSTMVENPGSEQHKNLETSRGIQGAYIYFQSVSNLIFIACSD